MRAAFAQGDYRSAAMQAAQVLALQPDDAEAWLLLGLCWQQQGRPEPAMHALRYCLRLQADNSEARYSLAILLWQGGELAAALQECHALLERHAAHAPTLSLSGILHVSLGDAEAARAAFSSALASDPAQIAAHEGLGTLQMQSGELPGARHHLREALRLRLGSPPVARPRPPSSGYDQASHERLLWQTLALLATAGVHAFPFAGTLLGLEREGRLLPFDKDLDVALPYSEMATACACLLQNGWQEESNPMRLLNPRSFRHAASGLILDLCGIAQEGDMLIGGFWQAGTPWEWQRIAEYPAPLQLQQQLRPEGSVWALNQPQQWLVALYGDWQTPDPNFDTVIAAYNLRGFALLTECFALDRINHYWRSGQLHKATALLEHCLRRLPEDALLRQAQQQLHSALARSQQPAQGSGA
ncbi:tetratricopeptide repeat protein [Chitinilyticum litopenaei]|uniref:tetratricopeptide repeat protein n=1 Tax=Chitinilyticum litopenaei TaxID=1121276 RepID=UPI00040788AC|nr:tetratricopeptide repeat protein [Chitinilyticum litopenaei]